MTGRLPILFTLIAGWVLLSVSSVEGQLFRRGWQSQQGPCANGQCPLPQYTAPVVEAAPVEMAAPPQQDEWYKGLVGPSGYRISVEEEQIVRSWAGRAVRIYNGNSCGTGNLVGRDEENVYILTNAHVAGTKLGHIVKCQALKKDGTVENFNGTVIEAAYSTRTRTDWALLTASPTVMSGYEPIKLSKEKPDDGTIGTWGCPQCKTPRGQVIKTQKMGSVWYWYPNSIGGQSGSAVVQDGLEVGLLTWTENGYGSGQFTANIWRQSQERNTDGPARTGSEVPVTPAPSVVLEDGYHGNANISDYPIWGSATGPIDPPADPPVIDDPDVKRLLDIRARCKEKGYDWVAIITLIFQLIELLTKK